jgi:hypothetical protein
VLKEECGASIWHATSSLGYCSAPYKNMECQQNVDGEDWLCDPAQHNVEDECEAANELGGGNFRNL